MFWFDPSDYAIAGKTLKLRLRLLIGVNAVAPGVVNYTLNMNTIPGFTGAAGVGPGITPGVAPAGAGVVVASPGALAASLATSADFNAPAASQYCLTIVVSALMAANSIVTCVGELAYRNV